MPASMPKTVPEIVRYFEDAAQITDHRFFERLGREPANLGHLWTLLANFQISISKNFAPRLAAIAGRLEDRRVLCILAEQLNDEMGNGDYQRAHSNLFAAMMKELEPWQPRRVDNRVLTPGRNLDSKLAEIYGASDLYVALGAVMVGEVFAKQMDQAIADQFRRQSEVDIRRLKWLVLHEELEVSHADSSTVLAELLPPAQIGSVWSGAEALSLAGQAFLDDLYELCFGSA